MNFEERERRRYQKRLEEFPKALRKYEEKGYGGISELGGSSRHIFFSNTFTDYGEKMRVDLWDVLEEYLGQMELVTVADVGCGRGDALREVKNRFGDRVRTVGFDLVELDSHEPLDEVVVGNFEEVDIPPHLEGQVQLMTCNNTFEYFLDYTKATERMERLLSSDGVAYVHIYGVSMSKLPEDVYLTNHVFIVRGG